jgi:hypothetical protein
VTGGELRELIEFAIGSVPYDPPITVDYCGEIRDVLRASLPDASIEVYHRHTELIACVRAGKTRYELVLPLV